MKSLIIGSLMIIFSGVSHARCIGPVVNGECLGTEVSGSDDSGYEGSSGTSYQYDLNNPIDQNGYSTDLDAQRRDQMNTDSRRNLDQNQGQYGGGIYER